MAALSQRSPGASTAEGEAFGATLVARERLFRAITGNAPVIIWMDDPSGRCIYLNNAWGEFTGRPDAEGLGEGWSDFVHPDDRAAFRAGFLATVARREPFEGEYRMRRHDGTWRWVVDMARPLFDDGAYLGHVGWVIDITDRKAGEAALSKSAERLRLAQKVSGVGIWDVDIATDTHVWSDEQYRLLGVAPGAFTPGYDSFARFVHAADRAAFDAAFADAFAGTRAFDLEFRIVRADGAVRWIASKGEVSRDPQTGAPTRFTGADQDITDRREAILALEERVAERSAQLLQAQKLEVIGQLTGGVAHDFNNLLSAVLGNLKLVRKRLAGDETVLRLIDGALEGAERGASLTRHLLAFARRQDLKLAALDLATLIRGWTEMLRQSIGARIEIEADLAPDLWPVRADATQLELALLNLALNARDAMPEGGRLRLAACNETIAASGDGLRAGAYVRLVVADTGTGMDEATLARAADPFFTTKGTGKGTGLGLSMVQGLAAQSGGVLRLSSRLGAGTTAELWLPRADAPPAAPAAPAAVPATPAPARALRVLVVDDDGLICMATAEMLRDMGHAVVEACSGRQALELLRGGAAVDLVVTDQAMPGMTGTQLAAAIRAGWPGLPIILATGYAELADASAAGLPRLNKPYDQDQLAAAIAALVGAV